MNATTSLFLTAGALALALSTPVLGQSAGTPSPNYAHAGTPQAGVEPDEIDNRATETQSATGQSRRRGAAVVEDLRAADGNAQASLLLPAVQAVRAADTPQPRTPVFMEIDDIEGEAADVSGDGQADIITGTRPGAASTGRPQRARRNANPN